MEKIALGGGCFWCTEAIFSMFTGVKSVIPGYAGGNKVYPTFEEVCMGKTGHAEVVLIEYDPKKLDLRELLEVFFSIHDPTTLNRQGNDIGTQYRSIILCTKIAQIKIAKEIIEELSPKYNSKIVTEVNKLTKFYPAEKDHVNYYQNNPNQPYCRLIISPKINKIIQMLSEKGKE
jgi:peptide-methionine (S)-S-oxide reductase